MPRRDMIASTRVTLGAKCPILHPHPRPDMPQIFNLPDLIPGDAHCLCTNAMRGWECRFAHTGPRGRKPICRSCCLINSEERMYSHEQRGECILIMSRKEDGFSSGRAFVSPTIRVASHQQHVACKPQHNTKQATLLAWNKIWGGLTEYL